jgi:ATP-dependent Clp protease ATP-binding subunit ClpB
MGSAKWLRRFVRFDEIEKASDSLWNLLFGILDKATSTLGDNRQVDCSSTLIFMASNTGAVEMSSLSPPGDGACSPTPAKVSRTGTHVARRKFMPEFFNRLDKLVVSRALGTEELNRINDIDLERVQQRFQTARGPLKRAIEPLLVHPLSNPIASAQIRRHDRIRIGHNGESPSLTFFRETDARDTWTSNGVAAA